MFTKDQRKYELHYSEVWGGVLQPPYDLVQEIAFTLSSLVQDQF